MCGGDADEHSTLRGNLGNLWNVAFKQWVCVLITCVLNPEMCILWDLNFPAQLNSTVLLLLGAELSARLGSNPNAGTLSY